MRPRSRIEVEEALHKGPGKLSSLLGFSSALLFGFSVEISGRFVGEKVLFVREGEGRGFYCGGWVGLERLVWKDVCVCVCVFYQQQD